MTTELPTTCDVVIVGAGLAGLSASRFLTAAGFDVHLGQPFYGDYAVFVAKGFEAFEDEKTQQAEAD